LLLYSVLALVAGLAILVWGADRFIDGAAAVAKHLGMPALLIGMVIVGFGTSAPEMVVSAMAALDGNPGLALGNAYGSNIANMGLILGLTALLAPLTVASGVLRRELPLLLVITLFAGWQLIDGELSRGDAWGLLLVFFAFMGWTIWSGLRNRDDTLSAEVERELAEVMPMKAALLWLLLGLLLLVAGSRAFVWGAVNIATWLGVSELVIGLTIVAVGTSLPELASSLVAVRKGEHDIAVGNVVGSNLFNTLAVVGIAAGISPLSVEPVVLHRDWMVMLAFTLALLAMGLGITRSRGAIIRWEGAVLLLGFIAYTGWLVATVIFGPAVV
jgi:cation:H+ antiporter